MIYLDNAATTYPKPAGVGEAVNKCMLCAGGNAGRGAHSLALAASKIIFDCRESAAEMFGASDSDRVFFTPNTTYGINAVLKGLLREGDHVLISDMEHNAVYRPIYKMAHSGKIEYDIFDTYTCDVRQCPASICAEIERHLKPNTRAVICTHASNICSEVMPLYEIGALCYAKNLLFIVDGAQSAGHEAIDIQKMNIDALCLPGHKGLFGLQGSGLVILGERVILDTLIEGGNGIDSLSPDMSLASPERYEAGTLATPAIAGLLAGMSFVKHRGAEYIAEHERGLCRLSKEILGNTRGVTLYAPEYDGSIVLFNVDGVPSEKVADILNSRGICVRAGFHCAALAHSTLHTPADGAVRMSFSVFNTPDEVMSVGREIRELLHS